MTEKGKKILAKIQRQCSRREYCVSDIRKKLGRESEIDAAEADEILESLIGDRFVDGLRYATAFSRDKASLAGWGAVKIRYALSARGIPRNTIDEALAEIDEKGASDKLDRLLETKAKTLEGDPQARLKLLKFALSRGYEYDEVRDRVSRFF